MALIYVYGDSSHVVIDGTREAIVIFSPAFYWFKVCEIPTKSISKAKKIASHMLVDKPEDFDELILRKNGVDYSAYSFNKETIDKVIKSLKMKNAKIYFADQLHITQSVAIDTHNLLLKFNDKVVELKIVGQKPSTTIKSTHNILLEDEKPIVEMVSGSKGKEILFSVCVAMLVIFIGVFSFSKFGILDAIDAQSKELKTGDRSFYEIKSMINRYKKLDKKKRKMKKEFEIALSKNGANFIEYDGKNIVRKD